MRPRGPIGWDMAQTRRMGMQNERRSYRMRRGFRPAIMGSRGRVADTFLNVYGQLPDIGFTIWPNGDERINGLRK
jgi:hypothetical protein